MKYFILAFSFLLIVACSKDKEYSADIQHTWKRINVSGEQNGSVIFSDDVADSVAERWTFSSNNLTIHQLKYDTTMYYTYSINKGIAKVTNKASQEQTDYTIKKLKNDDLVLSYSANDNSGNQNTTISYTFKKEN